jgi:putative iron-only hydrogenase system regulator
MLSCIIAPLGVLIFIVKGNFMETRVAVLAIIVENTESVEELNKTLHEYGNFIIGRMGLPYRKKNINIISVVIDAPLNSINNISGKLGRLEGVTVKTAYSKN